MSSNHVEDVSVLDEIRKKEGLVACKKFFNELLKTDKERAIRLLNDRRTTFPCVFVALPNIIPQGRFYYLSSKNKMALNIIKEVLEPERYTDSDLLTTKNSSVHRVLRWMVETGAHEDGFSNEYDDIMDKAVSVLISVYGDKEILPIVADLIFKRNRSDRLYHDLVWALFQIRNPYSLRLVADRMRSSDKRDVALACNLLGIEPASDLSENSDNRYFAYLNWLKENDPFLYFTGESLQYASSPVVCGIDYNRKYLGQGISGYERISMTPRDEFERESLAVFKPLQKEEKEILSDYSYRLYNQSGIGWEQWIHLNVEEQLKTAKMGEGQV